MPASVFIYGSCVSRDAFNYANEGTLHITDYYARNSLISALASPIPSSHYHLDKIASNFRRRAVERDLKKTLLSDLVKKQYDILLLDFIDERLSILKVERERERERERENNESFLTLSSEFMETQPTVARTKILRGFTLEKTNLWVACWQKFAAYCARQNLLDKIRINQLFFAKYNNESEAVAGYDPEQLDTINSTLEYMYAIVAQDIPQEQFLNYEEQLFVANKQHRWGESPFHYIDELYYSTLAQIAVIN